jgi:hypothetical protein
MRRVDTPQERARRRRRAKALDRRQARRSGPVVTRYLPKYGVSLLVLDAAAWNEHPRRAELDEPECASTRYAVVGETFPVDQRTTVDDGVLVIAHIELWGELHDVVTQVCDELADTMDAKFGHFGWLPAREAVVLRDDRT